MRRDHDKISTKKGLALGFWLTFSFRCLDGNTRFKNILILENRTGRQAFMTEASYQNMLLAKGYEFAKQNGVYQPTAALDCSKLISSDGYARSLLVLPSGKPLKTRRWVALGKRLHSREISKILHLGQDCFQLSLSARQRSGLAVSSKVIVDNQGVQRPTKRVDLVVETEKGHCLDRYVGHLLARSGISGSLHYKIKGSSFIDEVFMPNALSGDTIIHSKWGNRGDEVLDYIRRYGRLQAWCFSKGACSLHPLATATNLRDLQSLEFKLKKELGINAVIKTVSQWGTEFDLPLREIENELERIEALASIGDLASLKNRHYQPALPLAPASGLARSPTDWKEAVKSFAVDSRFQELKQVIDWHIGIDSPYWEREYHLALAKRCSFLLDRCLGEDNLRLTVDQRITLREKALKLYPVLSRYKDAWVTIEKIEALHSQSYSELVGGGRRPELIAFDLEEELRKAGLVEGLVSQDSNEEEIIRIRDEGLISLWAFVMNCVKDDPFESIVQIKMKADCIGPIPMSLRDRIRHELSQRIAHSILDVDILSYLPDELQATKGEPIDTFLSVIASFADEQSDRGLTYRVEGQNKAITAKQIVQALTSIDTISVDIQ